MSEWYNKPYKGKPPTRDIHGFPRALYPPDSAQYGKDPSSRGPDVVAYKRTLCRLGRWGVWAPESWDDKYWDEFAHGTPGHDIPNSGIAGFQYQQHYDATGWLGPKTFNGLCYALVPEAPGFQHGGEHAMDSVAVDLINDAWQMFQGHDTPPAESTLRVAALDLAIGELGYTENPPDTNNNKYGIWYGWNYQPWCAMFCTWAFENAGGSPSFNAGDRYAYVPYIVGDAYNGRNGLKVTDDPIPGDVVCYNWNWDGEYDHVGIFERWVDLTTFYAIEGNTSTSNNSNGGQVMRRTRSPANQGTVFVRVTE